MNKLIKLVLVNLLGLFDYNGVLKEVEAGVKGKSETRLIVVAIASIIYGYLVYIVFNMFGNAITNKSLIILYFFQKFNTFLNFIPNKFSIRLNQSRVSYQEWQMCVPA